MEEVERNSTIEIIKPPVNGYNYTQTLYLPATTSWITIAKSKYYLCSNFLALQQLSNGNVLFAMVQQSLLK
jgi:hypothetical protein